jgi:hypothetical protein
MPMAAGTWLGDINSISLWACCLSAAITRLFYTARFGRHTLLPLRRPTIPAYDKPMAKAKKFELESPAPILDEEDEETLAAIDKGIRDAKAGRTIPAEEMRRRLREWVG